MNQEINTLLERLKPFIDLEDEEIISMIEIPPERSMGDFAFPCFRLAKIFRKSPVDIAKELKGKIDISLPFSKIEAVGPYINFFLDRETVIKNILDSIKEGNFGSSDMGKGKKIIVEFSSTNIAKPFHIGHIRSTVIGNVLRNIYDKLGYDTVAVNHLGDYGTQFGMMIAAFKRWGDMKKIESNPIPEMLDLYVKFNNKIKDSEEYREEARYWFRELENNNQEAVDLWNIFKDLSLVEFNRVYNMLGIKFDSYAGESFYSDKMEPVLEELKEKDLLEESEGALIVNLEEYDLPPALVTKSDGSTLYLTRDLAAAIYRKKHYNFEKNLYIVGAPQTLHFQQVFGVLKKMDYDWADNCIHIPFGHITLEEGSMSTRSGQVVFLEDVLNSAIDKTKDIINRRNPNLEDKDNIASQIGIGAVIFQELFNHRIKDYTFSWEETLSFEGETGPYVQYTHARACSILERAGKFDDNYLVSSLIENEDAYRLVQALNDYPSAIIGAKDRNEPYILTRQILEIAKEFNKFYYSTQILTANKEDKNAYLHLLEAVKNVIADGLSILGIEAPEKM